jgi:hypothetical protein
MSKHINLETLAEGAFSARVNQAIQEVMENIADPNTPWKNKRKINIQMVFIANKDRNITTVDIVPKTTLSPREGVNTSIIIDQACDGEIVAAEYKKQIPGQEAVKVDPETGEIINKDENKNNKTSDGLQVIK